MNPRAHQTIGIAAMLLVGAGMSGCGRSSLTVHVDLFTATRTPPEQRTLAEKLADLRVSAQRVRDALTMYRTVFDANYANALESIGADADLTPAGRANKEQVWTIARTEAQIVFAQYLTQVGAFESKLVDAHTAALSAEGTIDLADRVSRQIESQKALCDAMVLGQILANDLKFEFGEVSDSRPRRLDINPDVLNDVLGAREVIDAIDALKKMQSNIAAAAMTVQGNIAGINRNIQTNPDLLADDSDPFLREIASGRARNGGTWKRDFFLQETKADGNASYLIVRKTPVRYTIHRATNDPSILVKSQLRLAQASLKTVGGMIQTYAAVTAGMSLPGTAGTQEDEAPGSMAESLKHLVNAASQSGKVRDWGKGLRTELQAIQTQAQALRDKYKAAADDAAREAVDAEAETFFKATVVPKLKGLLGQLDG